MLVFPCYSLQPAPSTVTQGLFIPGRLMCNMSLKFQKKEGKDRGAWRLLGYVLPLFFPFLHWSDTIGFSKYGREAGVASTFTACQIGRFTKRSCAPTTHTNYPNTTHTLPVESRQTGFLLRVWQGRKAIKLSWCAATRSYLLSAFLSLTEPSHRASEESVSKHL